jgi:hypothetical protein
MAWAMAGLVVYFKLVGFSTVPPLRSVVSKWVMVGGTSKFRVSNLR